MGCENRAEQQQEIICTSSPPSVSEALLFATISLIGHHVDVHVKDASVYSGIFYAASMDKDYGIVLKNARLTKKGRCDANVATGRMVETLVILSTDLVQVVGKGVQLKYDAVAAVDVTGDHVEAEMICTFESMQDEGKKSAEFRVASGQTNERQNCENKSECLLDDYSHRLTSFVADQVDEVPGSNANADSYLPLLKRTEGRASVPVEILRNEASRDTSAEVELGIHRWERPTSEDGSMATVSSGVSSSSSPTSDVTSESSHNALPATEIIRPASSVSYKSPKEFKLNPGAKDFSPSFLNPIPAVPPMVPAVANMGYMPSSPPIMAVGGPQPEVGVNPFAPRTSIPAKFAPHNNMAAGTGVSSSPFSQSGGQIGARTQPLRYVAPYPTVQAAPAYLNPNSQAVMVGRMGQQFVYMPVSQDMVPGAAGIPHLPTRPHLTPHHQVQYPKHQASAAGQALHLCVPQPYGQQPFSVPTHVPILQSPFASSVSMPIPGSNGLFGAKLP